VARQGDPGRRLAITLLAVAFVLTLFGGRLVQLQGMQSAMYKKLAAQERLTTVQLHGMRGTIYGAGGQQPLAMTLETFTVVADPTQIKPVAGHPRLDKPAAAALLAPLLGLPAAQVLDKLAHPSSPRYVKLEAGVGVRAGDAISALKLPGINLQPVYVRKTPDGSPTANIVGFTNDPANDGNIIGQSGIELEYNSLLSGHNGSEEAYTGTNGEVIPLEGSSVTPATDGSDITLTIIPALQLAAQQACQQQVAKMHARDCTVVVMSPQTGDILALAQWPTVSQADIQSGKASVAQATDLPVQNVFDPGSTAKIITAAAALEQGGLTPASAYDIPYGLLRGGLVIHDAEWGRGERYTLAGIIAHSSNVGMAQVASTVSPAVQYRYLRNFGLGQPTGLGLPGESAGILPPPSQWWASERYTLAYGQGVSVTALQMASVYATLANGGIRVPPRIVAGTTSPSGKYRPAAPSPSRQVIQPATARELIQILQQVPGVDAAGGMPVGNMPGYAIAGKTGTSNESGPNCPKTTPLCEYGSSYIGMAPGDKPQVVVAVNVQAPDKKFGHFGATVAGPVFDQIMNFAVQTLQIPPDGATVPYVRLTAP
jgi:cell division protein FtsI (penicillin-binding protein 3)